jgi:hypothetical protein
MSQSAQFIARIIVALIMIYIIFASLYLFYITIKSCCIKLYKCFRNFINKIIYKKATIVPIELAIITEEPIDSIATQVPMKNVSILSI